MHDQPDPHPHLSSTEVVLVSYKSRAHVEELVSGWPTDLRVVIVDNARGADGLREFADGHAHVRYLDGGGVGFGRAANLGALSSEQDHVVFVNPDCRPTADDLEALVAGLAADTTAASHAATMVKHDQTIEAGVGGWEPNPRRLLVHALGLGSRFPTSGLFLTAQPGVHYDVGWTTGACMAVRTETFRELGGFDETFYVYAEDVSFGRRSREAGLRSVLREDVTVRHGAGSSGAPSLEMLRLRGASFAYYLTKYHPRQAVLLRGLMVVGAVLRGAAAVVRRDRSQAAQQWAFIVGTVTRKAHVGGTEVAARRYAEVATA
ncbi:MAG: glycosyltransferase family 2 protein [Propionibacteriaceae bacterium]|nr:glycosyltransferase family 2 protein [Propionibacteriaceae bacterium]